MGAYSITQFCFAFAGIFNNVIYIHTYIPRSRTLRRRHHHHLSSWSSSSVFRRRLHLFSHHFLFFHFFFSLNNIREPVSMSFPYVIHVHVHRVYCVIDRNAVATTQSLVHSAQYRLLAWVALLFRHKRNKCLFLLFGRISLSRSLVARRTRCKRATKKCMNLYFAYYCTTTVR